MVSDHLFSPLTNLFTSPAPLTISFYNTYLKGFPMKPPVIQNLYFPFRLADALCRNASTPIVKKKLTLNRRPARKWDAFAHAAGRIRKRRGMKETYVKP